MERFHIRLTRFDREAKQLLPKRDIGGKIK